jgi:TolA-binding protein
MKNSVFLIFTLLLFTGLVALNGYVRLAYGPTPVLQTKLEIVKREKEEAEFKAQLAVHRLADYQQQIATLMPQALKDAKGSKESYPLRQLASVVVDEDKMQIERASGILEKAKAEFRDENFEESNRLFTEIIEKYPESVHVVEAHFLLAEGQFQIKEYVQSLGTIEHMIDLYPENELTGFALLRLGRIFEIQDRLEDAADVYRSVLNNFHTDEITKQAQASLKAVAL